MGLRLYTAKNFAWATVPSAYNASATTITLTVGEGARLPLPQDVGPFPLVWWNAATYRRSMDDSSSEIILCVHRDGDTLTVLRGQEGTTASAKDANSRVELCLSASFQDAMAKISKMLAFVSGELPGITAAGGSGLAENMTISGSYLNSAYTVGAMMWSGEALLYLTWDLGTAKVFDILSGAVSNVVPPITGDYYCNGWAYIPTIDKAVCLTTDYNSSPNVDKILVFDFKTKSWLPAKTYTIFGAPAEAVFISWAGGDKFVVLSQDGYDLYLVGLKIAYDGTITQELVDTYSHNDNAAINSVFAYGGKIYITFQASSPWVAVELEPSITWTTGTHEIVGFSAPHVEGGLASGTGIDSFAQWEIDTSRIRSISSSDGDLSAAVTLDGVWKRNEGMLKRLDPVTGVIGPEDGPAGRPIAAMGPFFGVSTSMRLFLPYPLGGDYVA